MKKNDPKKHLKLVLPLVVLIFMFIVFTQTLEEISNQDLVKLLEKEHIASIKIKESTGEAYITLNEAGKKATEGISLASKGPHFVMKVLSGFQYDYNTHMKKKYKNVPELNVESTTLLDSLRSILTSFQFWMQLAMFLFFLSFFYDGGGFGRKKKAFIWDKKNKTGITFQDVVGMEEAKQQLKDVVHYYKNPEKYIKLGARPFKGALMAGPPGTGKTLLARALAGEAEVALISVCGSAFDEIFVGSGSRLVRDLFKKAREIAPCIIFIDEIDAIGRRRSSSAHEQRSHEQTLNQLLNEIDGFNPSSGIFVLASTNHPGLLDSALVRPGRLGTRIYTNHPTKKERVATFVHYLKKMKVDRKQISVARLAEKTPFCSYAEISEICNLAATITARKGENVITSVELDEAVAQRIGGIKRFETILKPEEKFKIALHEIGHAFVSHCLKNADPLVSVNIIPRTDNTLGFAQYLPEETSLVQRPYLLDGMCVSLGGRAAEIVCLGEPSTGAQNDLEYVKNTAYAMVTIYGMSSRIGNISFYNSKGRDYGFVEPYSQTTKAAIDEEVRKIVDEQFQKALYIIATYKDIIYKVAKVLAEKEELSVEEFEEIVGKKALFVEEVEKNYPPKPIPKKLPAPRKKTAKSKENKSKEKDKT